MAGIWNFGQKKTASFLMKLSFKVAGFFF